MKVQNQKGFAEVVVLYGVIALLAALYIPNPVSSALGIGVRPNKTVQVHKETLEPLLDADGHQVAFKRVSSDQDSDIQQKVSLWEQFRALPVLFLLLIIGGAAGIPWCLVLLSKLKGAYQDLLDWKSHTHQIVLSVDEGLKTLPDEESRAKFKKAMKSIQDQEVQRIVGILQKPSLPEGI